MALLWELELERELFIWEGVKLLPVLVVVGLCVCVEWVLLLGWVELGLRVLEVGLVLV
jgi:hypothetical protein